MFTLYHTHTQSTLLTVNSRRAVYCKWSSYTQSSNVHYKQGLKLTVCKLKHINWKLEVHIN